MLYFAKCSADYGLTEAEIRDGFFSALAKLGARRKVIAVPPDFTRFHSQAGQ